MPNDAVKLSALKLLQVESELANFIGKPNSAEDLRYLFMRFGDALLNHHNAVEEAKKKVRKESQP